MESKTAVSYVTLMHVVSLMNFNVEVLISPRDFKQMREDLNALAQFDAMLKNTHTQDFILFEDKERVRKTYVRLCEAILDGEFSVQPLNLKK